MNHRLELPAKRKAQSTCFKKAVEFLEKELTKAEIPNLKDRIIVLETTVADLKRHKEESEKRNWQFIFIAVGAGCAIAGGIVVQLVASFLRK